MYYLQYLGIVADCGLVVRNGYSGVFPLIGGDIDAWVGEQPTPHCDLSVTKMSKMVQYGGTSNTVLFLEGATLDNNQGCTR